MISRALMAVLALTVVLAAAGCGGGTAAPSSSSITVHTIVGRWAAEGNTETTLVIKARNDGTYRIVWKVKGQKDNGFAVRMTGADFYEVVGEPSVYLTLASASRLVIKSDGSGLGFKRLTSEKPEDMALAAQQLLDGDPNGLSGDSSGTSKTSLAERVAANIDPRTDFTSFDIPAPKVSVTGPAAGGGKIVQVTYYVSGDDIFNENAFVDGVSPATVDVMAGAFSEPDVSIVDVTWKTDFTDQYGKSSKDAAFDIRWKRKTFKKVDIDGLFERTATSPEDLYRISDWYSIHPAIWNATHLKDQISMIGGN